MDGFIDTADLDGIIGAYNSFHPLFDLNDDGIVDANDLAIATPNIGLNIWEYFQVPFPTPWWVLPLALLGTGLIIGAIIWKKKK